MLNWVHIKDLLGDIVNVCDRSTDDVWKTSINARHNCPTVNTQVGLLVNSLLHLQLLNNQLELYTAITTEGTKT